MRSKQIYSNTLRWMIQFPTLPIILAIIMRLLALLRNRSFWLDDALISIPSKEPFVHLINGTSNFYIIHGPIPLYILHVLMRLTDVEFILRLPSAIATILVIIPIYKLVSLLFTSRIAKIATIFIACSLYLTEFSNELKGYPLLLLFEMWYAYSTICFIKNQTKKNLLQIILFGSCALWSDYSFFWFLIVMWSSLPLLCSYLRINFWRILPPLILAHVTIVLTYSWYWIKFFNHLYVTKGNQGGLDIFRMPSTINSIWIITQKYLFGNFGYTALLPKSNFFQITALACIPLIFMGSIKLISDLKKRIYIGWFALIWFTVPMLSSIILSIFVFHQRLLIDYHVMISLVGLYVFIAWIIDTHDVLRIFTLSMFLILNAIGFISFLSPVNIPVKYDWRNFVKNTSSIVRATDQLIFSDLYPEVYQYYFKTLTGKPLAQKPRTFILEQNPYGKALEEVYVLQNNVCLVSMAFGDMYAVEPRLTEASRSSLLSTQTLYRDNDLVLRCFR